MLVKFTRAYRLTRGVDQVGSTFNTIAGLRSRRGVIIKGAKRKVKLSTRARLSIVSAFQLWKRGIRFVVLEWPVRRHVRISIVFDSRKKKKKGEEVASRNRIVEFAMRKLLNYQMSRSNNREIFRNENWKGQRMIFDKMHFRKNLSRSSLFHPSNACTSVIFILVPSSLSKIFNQGLKERSVFVEFRCFAGIISSYFVILL